jgi:FtsH-binding integral membrane protein
LKFYESILRLGVWGIFIIFFIGIPLFITSLPILISLAIIFSTLMLVGWATKNIILVGLWVGRRHR